VKIPATDVMIKDPLCQEQLASKIPFPSLPMERRRFWRQPAAMLQKGMKDDRLDHAENEPGHDPYFPAFYHEKQDAH
jgi:hypothetical protein